MLPPQSVNWGNRIDKAYQKRNGTLATAVEGTFDPLTSGCNLRAKRWEDFRSWRNLWFSSTSTGRRVFWINLLWFLTVPWKRELCVLAKSIIRIRWVHVSVSCCFCWLDHLWSWDLSSILWWRFCGLMTCTYKGSSSVQVHSLLASHLLGWITHGNQVCVDERVSILLL